MNQKRVDPSNKYILIVDDTPENLRLLERILTRQGYNVYKASDGHSALSETQTHLPDLILLDIMMPDMDGYEVCLQLKADEKTNKIPVVFLSALDDVLDKIKAFQVGGFDYITKPFQPKEVLIRVENQLVIREAEMKILQLNEELENRVKERTFDLKKANDELKREIVERQHLQNQLLHLALHDSLTNLPNRALFIKSLETALNRSKEEPGYQFAVLFLDCDRFKVVNDSLGHLVGDELLVAIAHRLQDILSEGDILARLGGDEFAILVGDIRTIDHAIRVAEKILQQLSTPFKLSRHEVFINASIGIALSNPYDDKPEYLLRDADTAMYRAKALGKGRYHVFDPEMHEQAIHLLRLENDLKRAIEREEFRVYYQPIITLATGKINGFEALIRWEHPIRGMVSPAEFIPIAEETGLISAIDLWVLEAACEQLKAWQQLGVTDEPLTISVNLSGRLLSRLNIIEEIDQVLTKTRLNPENLKIEITETVMMENPSMAAKILEELRSRNIHLSIDDFGTGYSSLSYLDRFAVNTLKIDQSFVKRLDGNLNQMGLVPAMISIAHTMGMKAIAEGIETAAQLSILNYLGCDLGQGYFFSKPLESIAVVNFLRQPPTWQSF